MSNLTSELPPHHHPTPTRVTTSIEFYPLGITLFILCILGIIGNTLCAIVLKRPKLKSTYSLLALTLAVVDATYLLIKFLRFGLESLFKEYSIGGYYTNFIHPIVGPELRALNFTAQMASTYITVILALDRYLTVCKPIYGRTVCTRKNAKILIFIVLAFVTIYNIPRWLEYYTEPVKELSEESGQNETVAYKMTISPLRQNPFYKKFYIFWMYFIFIDALPFICLSVFNFKIISVIRKHSRTNTAVRQTSHQKREASFTLMLIAIVIVFLICNAGFLVTDILSYIGQPYPQYLDEIGNLLLTINSVVNFIIYCIFGKKFRQEFMQMFRKSGGAPVGTNNQTEFSISQDIKENIDMDQKSNPN